VGKTRGLDNFGQQQAFEILCASIVLSFFEDPKAEVDPAGKNLEQGHVVNHILQLRHLAWRAHLQQGTRLRMFVTGPAGAGKSAILNALKGYAASFRRSLSLPFNRSTIQLTALTGATAIEIGVETLHSVANLMCKKPIDISGINRWENTRMIVVDEISCKQP
jgi:hypothetical protein